MTFILVQTWRSTATCECEGRIRLDAELLAMLIMYAVFHRKDC